MENHEEEIWKPVAGWEGLYEVSDRGRVRSLPRASATRRLGVRGKILKPRKGSKGHLIVNLSVDRTRGGRREHHFVHRLVLTAFVEPRPDGALTRHRDGDPENNRPYNLVWGTHLENHQDAVEHGTFEHGEMRSQAKLTNAQVIEMREAAAAGAPTETLAERYGIAYRTAHHIVTGVKWKRVGGPIQPRRDRWYLCEDDVRAIRRLSAEGRSLTSLGKQFGVPPNSIKNVRDRNSYKWVD